ncbi:MAG: phenylacetate--CoA ligase family protein, partial [Pseudomonadota bacterium]|nr:phenylacetate--CoA ligase family protein [Pseudomonadota bacterium]
EEYDSRGIFCRQCYGTADVGLIAYESVATDGLIIDEKVVVEIVRPGTGEPVPDGEIGEVVVTAFNPDFPMIRFATGDLSAILPGMSSCGRTNRRIVGWRGRADQAAKVKGMFVRPEQVAQLANRHKEINRIRLTITHDGSQDQMTVQIEGAADAEQIYADSVRDILKLRGQIEIVAKDSLPNDGMVIDDQRTPG